MSETFRARFDTTDLALEDAITRLQRVLLDAAIVYERRVTPMISQRGWPAVDISDRQSFGIDIGRLADVAKAAKNWWGVNLSCFSVPLAGRLGPGEWVEVDIVLFPGPLGRLSLMYTESGVAHRSRLSDERSARELYALQLELCKALGFQISLYEKADVDLGPTVSLGEVHQRIERARDGVMGCSVAVSQASMDLDAARQLAGSHSNLVRQAAGGYTLFPFLLRDRSMPARRVDGVPVRP